MSSNGMKCVVCTRINGFKLKPFGHLNDNKTIVDEVTVIRSIDSDQVATKILLNCKGDTFVYHTSKPKIIMNVIRKPSFRENLTP